jgi:hypothetical protein
VGLCWFFLPYTRVSVVCWPTGIWCTVYVFLFFPVACPEIQILLVFSCILEFLDVFPCFYYLVLVPVRAAVWDWCWFCWHACFFLRDDVYSAALCWHGMDFVCVRPNSHREDVARTRAEAWRLFESLPCKQMCQCIQRCRGGGTPLRSQRRVSFQSRVALESDTSRLT